MFAILFKFFWQIQNFELNFEKISFLKGCFSPPRAPIFIKFLLVILEDGTKYPCKFHLISPYFRLFTDHDNFCCIRYCGAYGRFAVRLKAYQHVITKWTDFRKILTDKTRKWEKALRKVSLHFVAFSSIYPFMTIFCCTPYCGAYWCFSGVNWRRTKISSQSEPIYVKFWPMRLEDWRKYSCKFFLISFHFRLFTDHDNFALCAELRRVSVL